MTSLGVCAWKKRGRINMVPVEKIEAAYERMSPYLRPTRLEKSLHLSSETSEVYMKLENEQPIVKTFKIRGVLSKLTSLSEKELHNNTMAAISSGNHGVALAYCAQLLGLKSPVIFVPETAPEPKVQKIQSFGGSIRKVGHIYDDTHLIAGQIIAEEGYTLIDAREDEDGVVGQASIGIEILQELPDVDCVLIPMGSGGSCVSNASYFKARKPNVKVYGVEAENSPALIENLKNGAWTEFYNVNDENPLLKSLIGGVAKYTYDNADVLEDILLVNDREAGEAVAEILREEKVVVEPDSAVVYAAYKKYAGLFAGKKTAMVFSGGNIDDSVFKAIVERYY